MFSLLRHQVFDHDDPGIANAHAGRILSKVPAKVEEFGRDHADIQICTALLRSMTRRCTRRHRSQFWLAIGDANSEFCGFRDETLTLAADKNGTPQATFFGAQIAENWLVSPLHRPAIDLDARHVDEPSPSVTTAG